MRHRSSSSLLTSQLTDSRVEGTRVLRERNPALLAAGRKSEQSTINLEAGQRQRLETRVALTRRRTRSSLPRESVVPCNAVVPDGRVCRPLVVGQDVVVGLRSRPLPVRYVRLWRRRRRRDGCEAIVSVRSPKVQLTGTADIDRRESAHQPSTCPRPRSPARCRTPGRTLGSLHLIVGRLLRETERGGFPAESRGEGRRTRSRRGLAYGWESAVLGRELPR